MHRKLKKVIEIVDFWLAYPLECEFSESRPSYMEVYRETEAYAVLLSRPSASGTVSMRIVPKNGPLSVFSDVDRENIAYNELNIFRVSMMFQEMDEKNIRLDKKGRRQFHAYLASRDAELKGGS